MNHGMDGEIEAAFGRLVSAGPEHALTRLEELGDKDPALRARLDPLVKSYVSRHRRTAVAKPDPPIDLPALPDRFRVIRFLGSGGFGHVYQAVDTRYDAEVAVKILHAAHSSSLRRFKEEFTHLSGIAGHDNLVSLYEGFFDTNPWLFTMEYVDGVSLLAYVQQSTDVNRQQRIRSCLGQLADGVHALHLNKCHHRDLKPSNVLVTGEGKVKVIDFGLVREFGDGFEEPVSLVGTLDYMSPEQLTRSTVTELSDWYAVGVMLYELLTGVKPSSLNLPLFSSGDGLVPPGRLSAEVPEDLSALCVRLLARDPRQRASYAEIAPITRRSEQPALTARRDAIFVGREVERGRLAEYFGQSRAHPIVVYVSGPSGVGKTALIRQVQADIRRDHPDAVVVGARCHQNRSVPYPSLDDLVDRLGRYLSTLSREKVEQILPRNFAALVRMFPVMEQFCSGSHVLPARESTELRIRGFAALGELLGRLSDRHPVVLSIDDLQWGDHNGCVFLKDLMASADAPRLMLILCYRPDGGDVASWLGASRPPARPESGGVEHRMRLRVLDEADATLLARNLLVAPLADDAVLARQIVEVSGRVPYLVAEVAEWANRHGARTTGLDVLSTDDVLRERINGLDPDSRRLLELVAIAGQPTALDELRETCRVQNALEARDELRRDRLTLSRVLEGQEQIEVYHARVRDAVLQMLDGSTQALRHREMARALEANPQPDCERIAIHLERAGDTAACGLYARLAGDQAFQALAFEKAVQFYQLALKAGSLREDARRGVLSNLADALANSGHCADSARVYTEAASFAQRRQQLELTARAGDQLLRGGYIREGLKVLDEVMARLDLKPPRTRAGLLARVAWLRMRLALRGLTFEERPAADLAEEERLRLEVCWIGAMVTSLIDPLRSAESSARYVLLALRSGDPSHVTTALSCEAPLLCITSSKRGQAKAHKLLETAGRLADEAGDPHASARYLLSKALVAFVRGDWKTAFCEGDAAADLLRTRCVNVTWELATAHIFSSAARFIRGDWAENRRRVPTYVRESESRGDSNVAVSLRVQGCAYLLTLAANQPADALRQLREDVAAWSHEHPDFFRCNVMQAEVDIALYSDDPMRAHEVIERDWAKLERALLLRNPTTFAFLHFARGRAALAMAAHVTAGSRRRVLLDRAESAARALQTKGPVWSHGLASVLRAGVASWRVNHSTVEQYLREAEVALAVADIQPVRVAVSYQLTRRAGERQGNGGAEHIEEWARREGVERIDRVAVALAPGNYDAYARAG